MASDSSDGMSADLEKLTGAFELLGAVAHKRTCPHCNGKGFIPWSNGESDPEKQDWGEDTCPTCKGRGCLDIVHPLELRDAFRRLGSRLGDPDVQCIVDAARGYSPEGFVALLLSVLGSHPAVEREVASC